MKAVPTLRFKSFSEDWSSDNFLSFLEEEDSLAYGVLQPGNDLEGGVPMIRTVDLDDFGLKSDTQLLRIPEELDEQYKRTRLKGGELIISVMGTLGRVIIVPKEWSGWNVNRALAVARLNDSINKRFLIQILRSPQFEKKVVEEALGSAQKRINLGDLKEYMFTFPSLPEQQKIASFLSAVDEKIQQLTRKKELLEQYKKGVMQQLFSGKLRFKDENGKPYPEWEESKLGDIAEIVGGGTPETSVQKYWDGPIHWFTPTEINQRFVTTSKRTITEEGLKNSSAKLLPVGTLLLTSRATIAEISFAKVECTTNQGFQSLIVNNENSSEYIYYWIKQNTKEFLRRSQGSTFPEISKNEISKIRIKVPCLDEQQKISNFLSAIDSKIENVSIQVEQSQNFKKGLLQQMFV